MSHRYRLGGCSSYESTDYQYAERTPAMAIGITDTVWSALRLLGTVVLPTPCWS